MSFSTAIILLLFICDAFSMNECPKITTQKHFDIDKYFGVWYEAYRNENIFEFGYICANATYTKNTDGSIGVLDQAQNIFGTYASLEGTARVKNVSEPAAFEIEFPPPVLKSSYNVIISNYLEYALIYSCSMPSNFSIKTEFIYMLSRKKTLSQSTFNELKKILVDMGADASTLQPTLQNC